MAIDRETIIFLHNKNESNSTTATKLHICCETVLKFMKTFLEIGSAYA